MSFTFLNQLPTPAQIKEEYPLSKELTELKAKRDAMISDVICGKDDRFLVIIGPCSADNEDSVCDYVSRLTKIQEDVKDRVIIIPRVYTNKPRTTGEGYKGIAFLCIIHNLVLVFKRLLSRLCENSFGLFINILKLSLVLCL